MVKDSRVKAAVNLSMASQFLVMNWDFSFHVNLSHFNASLFIVGLQGCQCEELYKSLLRVFVRDFSWTEEYDDAYGFWSISIECRL